MHHSIGPRLLTKVLVSGLLALPLGVQADGPIPIKGGDLALRWPQLVGSTVQIAATPVQALDTARYYVKIDEVKAVMIMMPDKVWSGRKTVCAMVLGPEKMNRGGQTQVVGLMWKACEG